MNAQSPEITIDPIIITKFLEVNPVPIAQYDAEFRFTFCNQAFCNLMGKTRESILNTKVSDIKVLRMEGEGSQVAIREKRQVQAFIEADLPSGRKCLNTYTIPILNEAGSIEGVFGVYLDVTESHLEKQKTTQIIEENPIPFLVLGKDLRITTSNQAFLQISGYSRDQLSRMKLADFRILSMKGESARLILEKKAPVQSETELEFPTGIRIVKLHSIPILGAGGEVEEILITIVDLTGIRRQANFLVSEITRLSGNLARLAEGNFTFDLTVGESDQYTADAAKHFSIIQENMGSVETALKGVISEISSLSDAIQTGTLDTRGRSHLYKGAYAEIIEGLNTVMGGVEDQITAAITLSGEYAGGNFASKIPQTKAEGDFLKLKEALVDIGVKVSQALSAIDKEMEELTQRAEEASAGVRDVAEGSGVVARNAQDVSEQSERGKENLEQVLRAMMDLSGNVEEVASSTESVSRATHETNGLSKQGVELAHKAESGMKGIMESTGDVDRIITEIKEEMQKIGKIVSVITDIASQTNLLALNAAIEAARAGEAGRGFAVVASEVKALALESRSSAENIADMIGNLQKKSDQASVAMGQAGSAVDQGNAAVLETLEIFNQIVTSVDNIAKNMDDVSATTEQQAASVEEITASSHEVSRLVEDIAKEAISSAAAAEQSASGTQQIATVIEDLNHIILKVSGAIGKFRFN